MLNCCMLSCFEILLYRFHRRRYRFDVEQRWKGKGHESLQIRIELVVNEYCCHHVIVDTWRGDSRIRAVHSWSRWPRVEVRSSTGKCGTERRGENRRWIPDTRYLEKRFSTLNINFPLPEHTPWTRSPHATRSIKQPRSNQKINSANSKTLHSNKKWNEVRHCAFDTVRCFFDGLSTTYRVANEYNETRIRWQFSGISYFSELFHEQI